VLLQPFINEESIYQLLEITDPSELKRGHAPWYTIERLRVILRPWVKDLHKIILQTNYKTVEKILFELWL